MSRNAFSYIILALVVLGALLVRFRLLDLPMERDEGEFALMGKMILDGIPPYQEAYNLKPPGIYLAYAAVMGLFGRSAAGIHVGLLLLNLACGFLVYRITERLSYRQTAMVSAAAFIALTLMPRVLGLSAHATHFVLLPALGGILLLMGDTGGGGGTGTGPKGGWRLFFAGVLMGVAVLMKQPGIFFVLFGALMVWRSAVTGKAKTGKGRVLSGLGLYSAGTILPVAAALAWLFFSGVFARFWFWVVTYALSYGSEVGVGEGLEIAAVVGWSVVAPALAVAVVACLGFAELKGMPGRRKTFVLGFLVAAILAVGMGFHFRRHYFVLLLPVAAILFGLGLRWLESRLAATPRLRRTAPLIAAVAGFLAIGQTFAAGSDVYFSPSPAAASRVMFGGNPFAESKWIGERAGEMAGPGGRIAVVGSEPQIYFYADRLPATGYIYTYSLVGPEPISKWMRREMIGEIQNRRPEVVVYVNNPSSWLLDESSDRSIFSWLEDYVRSERLVLQGVVEIISRDSTVTLLGAEARAYTPVGRNFIMLWKRQD